MRHWCGMIQYSALVNSVFFNNKCNTFFGLNLTLVYTFPMCMAWRFHFPIRNYDFNKHNNLIKVRNCLQYKTVWAIPAETMYYHQTMKSVQDIIIILFLQIIFSLHDNGQVYLP